MGQLGSVSQGCQDVFGPEGWIALQYRFYCGPLAEAVQNDRNWNPRTLRAEFASTDLGIAAEKLLPIGHFSIVRSSQLLKARAVPSSEQITR
jgi:hypothetical protein